MRGIYASRAVGQVGIVRLVSKGLLMAVILIGRSDASDNLSNSNSAVFETIGEHIDVAAYPSGSDCDTHLNQILAEQINSLKSEYFGRNTSTEIEYARVVEQISSLAIACVPWRTAPGDTVASDHQEPMIQLIEDFLIATAGDLDTPILKSPLPPGDLASLLSKLSGRATAIRDDIRRSATTTTRVGIPASSEMEVRVSELEAKNLDTMLAIHLATEVRILWGEAMRLDLEGFHEALRLFQIAVQDLRPMAEAVVAECQRIDDAREGSVPPSMIEIISGIGR